MRAVLHNINFRRLWIAQVALSLGDAVMQMGLVEFFRVHGYSVRDEAAKLLFASALPALVFGPVAVVWLDRWQRRSVLMVSDALRAVCVALMVLGTAPEVVGRLQAQHVPLIYLLMFAVGTMTTFYYPARYAWIPNLVEARDLIQANTVFTVSLAVANVGGRAVGGFVAERLGVTWALLANVLAYVASILLVWRIVMVPHAVSRRARKGAPTTAHDTGSPSTTHDTGLPTKTHDTSIPPTVHDTGAPATGGGIGELREGWRYLWTHPSALPLVVLSGVFAFLLGILAVAIVGYAVDTLGLRTGGLGYLVAAAGVGAGVGIAVLGRGGAWTKSVWLPLAQLVLAALVIGGLGLTATVWVAAPLLFALGAVGATVLIPIDAKLQEEVEDARRGAVFAARGMLTSATMVVAFWLQFGTRLFRDTPAPTILLWTAGGALAAAGLTFLALRRRRKR
jgi:MFS family permease